jgi:hypothetical protein
VLPDDPSCANLLSPFPILGTTSCLLRAATAAADAPCSPQSASRRRPLERLQGVPRLSAIPRDSWWRRRGRGQGGRLRLR